MAQSGGSSVGNRRRLIGYPVTGGLRAPLLALVGMCVWGKL